MSKFCSDEKYCFSSVLLPLLFLVVLISYRWYCIYLYIIIVAPAPFASTNPRCVRGRFGFINLVTVVEASEVLNTNRQSSNLPSLSNLLGLSRFYMLRTDRPTDAYGSCCYSRLCVCACVCLVNVIWNSWVMTVAGRGYGRQWTESLNSYSNARPATVIISR